MTFTEAIHALVGAPHLLAFRPAGPLLTLTRLNRVIDNRGPKPRDFHGIVSDYLAIDWQVMKQSDFAAMMQKIVDDAAAQQAAAAGQGGDLAPEPKP